MAGNDKQLYKRFNSEQGVKPNDRQALSPPQTGLGVSPGRCQYRYTPADIYKFMWQKMMLEVVI
jgi:hypothetical protein